MDISETKMKESSNITKQIGFALLGVCLAYILSAIFLHIFLEFYYRYGIAAKYLLATDRWGEIDYDGFPVRVFYGTLYVLGPILAILFIRVSRSIAHKISNLQFFGLIFTFAPLTWGVGKIITGGNDPLGTTIILACLAYLYVLFLIGTKSHSQDFLGHLVKRIDAIPLAPVRLFLIGSGITLFFLSWMAYLFSYSRDGSTVGVKIGIILLTMIMGLTMVISNLSQYLKVKKNKLITFKFLNNFRFPSPFIDIVVWAVIFLILFPSNVTDVAAKFPLDEHVVQFFIGSAMNTVFGSGLIPGVDYYSQHGVGLGPIFSPLIGNTLFDTYSNYILGTVLFCIVFYGLLYHVLRDLFSSRMWAFAVTLSIIVLNFSTETWLNGPSNTPLRFTLLPLFVWLITKTFVSEKQSKRNYFSAITGVVIGFSMFVYTETGIYMLSAAIGGGLLYHQFKKRSWWDGLIISLSTFVSFLLLCFSFYGIGIFSQRFFVGIFEIILAMGSGFADFPLVWTEIQTVLYNTVSPLISLATIAWVFASDRERSIPTLQKQKAYILIFSIFTIFLSLKYINRGYQRLWLVASICSIIVMAWWLRFLLRKIFHKYSITGKEKHISTYSGTGYVLTSTFAAFATLIFFIYASMNIGGPPTFEDAPLGIKAFSFWPSMAKSILTVNHSPIPEEERWDDAIQPAQTDLDLIARLTEPGERITVFAENDFAYYHGARRAAEYPVIPSKWTFFDYYIDYWINKEASPVFVEKIPDSISAEINAILDPDYLRYSSPHGGRLSVYLRLDNEDITFKPHNAIKDSDEVFFEPGKLNVIEEVSGGSLTTDESVYFDPDVHSLDPMTRGPFIRIPSGAYEIQFWLKVANNTVDGSLARLEIIANEGELVKDMVITGKDFRSPQVYQSFSLTFDTSISLNAIEFLVYPIGDQEVWLEKITLTRTSPDAP